MSERPDDEHGEVVTEMRRRFGEAGGECPAASARPENRTDHLYGLSILVFTNIFCSCNMNFIIL